MIWSVVAPLVAAGGVAALIGVAALRPAAEPEWRELLVPDDLSADQVVALLRHIAAVREGPVSIAVVGLERRIRFFLGAPRAAMNSVVAAGAGVIATSRFEVGAPSPLSEKSRVVVGARVGWPGRYPLLSTRDPQLTVAALLGVLGSVERGQRLELRLRLWPAPRISRPVSGSDQRLWQVTPWLLRWLVPGEPPREDIRLIRGKYSGLLALTEVLVGSSAGTRRAAIANAERVIAALRTSGGPRGVLRYRPIGGVHRLGRVIDRRRRPLPWELTTPLLPEELVSLVGLPIEGPAVAGVSYGAGPRLIPPLNMPTRGRVLATSNFPATAGQPLAQPVLGGLQHMLALGPTGSGKSTLIGSLIREDLNSGRGAFVLDLKGDLVNEVLAAVPRNRTRDVVVLEPAKGGAQPGLRLFARDGDPELTSDLILGTLAEMFSDSWGIRSSQYLGLGLRTLAALPDSTLVDLPTLFTDDRFRGRLLKQVDDPWIRAAWARFLALSASERAVHVSSPLTKLEELVGRGRLRLVLGQSHSKLDFREVLARGRVVLVSLPPGLLGMPATRLLAALTLWQFFQAVEARAGLDPKARSPYFAYIDEVAVLRDLPLPLEAILERARGHGCGLALSPQALSQLTPSLRSSLLTNVGSLVAFKQNSEDEARLIAKSLPGVTASQLQHLGHYEVAMRLSLGPGLITPTMTGATLPPAEPVSDPEHVRRTSAARWGQSLAAIDAELSVRHGLNQPAEGDPSEGLGVRRRRA